MRFPAMSGIIRRRLLINFRVDPEVMARQLPSPFRPKLQEGFAIAGICLIRLEQIRPAGLPSPLGLASENAAHRIAVLQGEGPETSEAVYIPRRDSSSLINHLVGGRLFPGRHHRARFRVQDREDGIDLSMTSRDGAVSLRVAAEAAARLPGQSVFRSLDEASAFFAGGSLGYSTTGHAARFDAVVLETEGWRVAPLAVRSVSSSYFDDPTRFPPGSVVLDHALIMRHLRHRWIPADSLYAGDRAGAGAAPSATSAGDLF